MRTAPTNALEVALDMPPLDLRMMHKAGTTAKRLL